MEFGAHVSSSGGIDTAIDRIEAIGGDCVQVFTQSPRMWRPTNHKPEAIERFKARRREAGIGGVVCHAIYLCNLAATDEGIYERSIQAMRNTVDAATAIGADGVIFHVGSNLGLGFEAAVERTTAALAQILERCDAGTWLLMENSAGAGGTIGRSVEELEALVERLDRHPRLGICLDSCHLYASGYDVTDAKSVEALVRQLDAGMGLDRLRALHINDSAAPLGSNRDRHANIGEGVMGEGLGTFLAHPELQHLATYRKLRGLHARATAAKPKRRARPTRP